MAEDSDSVVVEETSASVVKMALQSYREALANDDPSTIAETEAFFQSIEDEKASLAAKVSVFSAELSTERDRVIRISADFDNFRKRTEREKLSLVSNVQGEVIEKLLPVLDNFERAKAQIKIGTEGEDKINNSYQNIYKQFVEILGSLGVAVVETVGTPFDPMVSLHIIDHIRLIYLGFCFVYAWCLFQKYLAVFSTGCILIICNSVDPAILALISYRASCLSSFVSDNLLSVAP